MKRKKIRTSFYNKEHLTKIVKVLNHYKDYDKANYYFSKLIDRSSLDMIENVEARMYTSSDETVEYSGLRGIL